MSKRTCSQSAPRGFWLNITHCRFSAPVGGSTTYCPSTLGGFWFSLMWRVSFYPCPPTRRFVGGCPGGWFATTTFHGQRLIFVFFGRFWRLLWLLQAGVSPTPGIWRVLCLGVFCLLGLVVLVSLSAGFRFSLAGFLAKEEWRMPSDCVKRSSLRYAPKSTSAFRFLCSSWQS